MAMALKNRICLLNNGLTRQTMGGKSRKRPIKLNLHHQQQVKWEIPVYMKRVLLFFPYTLTFLSSAIFCGCARMPPLRPLFPDDPKGLNLPSGVPRAVDRYGNVIAIPDRFTTPQYTKTACQLLLQEANRVAEQTRLPGETLPITESKVTSVTVMPFGYAYIHKSIGVVCTSNYVYMVSDGDKFSGLDVANYDAVCAKLARSSLLPISRINTNGFAEAYQLATQWLEEVSVDVNGLNRYCKSHVAFSPYWNGLARIGQMPRRTFVPIYYVWWTSPENDAEGFGEAASVELFLPAKQLIQLMVDDPEFNLRKPLIFTNLASLFPGTGRVTVIKGETGPPVYPGHN